MKQNFETPSKRRAGASGRGRSAASGRFQLGRALGNALSGSFDAFEGRLGGGGWRGARAAARPHADRLREVLDRDRALIAAERLALAAPEMDGAEAKTERPLAALEAEGAETESAPETQRADAKIAHSLAAPEAEGAEAETEQPSPARETEEAEAEQSGVGRASSEPAPQSTRTLAAPEGEGMNADAAAGATAPDLAIAVVPAAVEDASVAAPASGAGMKAVGARATALPPVPPSLAAALAKETPRALCDEPIRTRTMARLLAAQGYRKRALSIYEHLLALGDDPALRAEADALRRPGA